MEALDRLRFRYNRWRADKSILYCELCGKDWHVVAPHMVRFAPGRAAFALCEQCWSIGVYKKKLFDGQKAYHVRIYYFERVHANKPDWPAIKKAIFLHDTDQCPWAPAHVHQYQTLPSGERDCLVCYTARYPFVAELTEPGKLPELPAPPDLAKTMLQDLAEMKYL